MQRTCVFILVAAGMITCTTAPRYDAPFSAVDQNRDAVIEWREFDAYYPDAHPKAFLQADRSKDGQITPQEWQFFSDVNTTR